jgi:putative transposase
VYLTVEPPKYFRRSQDKLAKLQQKASARKKGSRAKKLLYKKVAKLHQKIARQRKQFHFELSKQLLTKYDVVFVEDLTVKNMVLRNKPKQDEKGNYLPNNQSSKSGLNKSILDCGWSQFLDILSLKAERAGLKVIKINPRGTWVWSKPVGYRLRLTRRYGDTGKTGTHRLAASPLSASVFINTNYF